MIAFNQFKEQVIKDLGVSYKPSMEPCFQDHEAEGGQGFQFQISSGAYGYNLDGDHQWLYDAGRGAIGRGVTLAEAQEAEEVIYDNS